MDQLTKLKGIERHNLPGDDKQIVGCLIVHQQVPVTVVDQSSGGVIGKPANNIPGSILFIGTVDHLKYKKPNNETEGYKKKDRSQYIFPLGKFIHCNYSLNINNWLNMIKTIVNNELKTLLKSVKINPFKVNTST
jgi:hypothetical protein